MTENFPSNNVDGPKPFMITAGKVFAGVDLTLFIFGFFANLFTLLIIFLQKEYKKSATHWYALQLAIADTVFLLTIPFKTTQYLNHRWAYSSGLCKFVEAVLFINYYASIIFLMVMSFDRYLAVCHSLSNCLSLLRKKVAYYIITALVWTIAICFAIPVMLYSDVNGIKPYCECSFVFPVDPQEALNNCLKAAENVPDSSASSDYEASCYSSLGESADLCMDPQSSVQESGANETDYDYGDDYANYDSYPYAYNQNNESESESPSGYGNQIPIPSPSKSNIIEYEGACHYFQTPFEWRLYVWLNFGLMFILPIAIMSLCYGLIIFHISKMKMSSSSSSSDHNRRVTLMCIILVSVFTSCWIFFHALHIAKIFGINLSGNACSVLTKASVSFAFLNSALNPYLYSFLGTGCEKKLQSLKSTSVVQQVLMFKTRSSSLATTNIPSRSKFSEKNSSHFQENSLAKNSSSIKN